MIEVLSIFAQLLLLMFFLIIVGEPIRIVFSKYSELFRQVDILQASVLDVYLGGLILYVICLVPLELFSATVAWGITVAFGILSVFFHWKELKIFFQSNKDLGRVSIIANYLSKNKTSVIECIATFAMFMIALWILVTPLPNLIFGSIHDTSLHSLFTQVIIENRQVPTTMQPYLPEGIIYPQAAHVLFAYACYILECLPPEAIFHVTSLFQAMPILGAYYLGRALSSRRLGVSLAFVFFCVSRWPRLLTWGSNPYIVAFSLQFISFAFVPLLNNSQVSINFRRRVPQLLVIGILFGYLAALHLTLYSIVVATAAILTLITMVRKRELHGLGNLLVVLGFSSILISVFVYRFVIWHFYPGHNIGLPADYRVTPFQPLGMLNWYLFREGISPHSPLIPLVIILMGLSCFVIFKMRQRLTEVLTFLQITLASLLASSILFLLSHFQFVFPSLAMVTGEVTRPSIGCYISFCFLVGIFNILLLDISADSFRKRLMHIFLPAKHVMAKTIAATLALLILLSMYSPYVYYTVAYDATYLAGGYGMFSATTRDDYELMLWIRDNLPNNAVILVNAYEPGTFIPSISNRKAIYPWAASKNSPFYLNLISLIREGSLNSDVYGAMKNFDVTYVYVGTQATYLWENDYKWDPQIFLSNPNFSLVRKVGDAYLFEVRYGKPNIVLEESFEYNDLSEMGWKFGVSTEHLSNGSGYVGTTFNFTYEGNRSLIISTQKETGLFYANWIYRKVYVWDTSNVTLHCYINASIGFQSPDELNIYVFDTSWSQHITFASLIHQHSRDNSTITLPEPAGFFSFDISRIWRQIHNSTLPTSFFLMLQNIDFDGVANIGYVDYIKVEVGD